MAEIENQKNINGTFVPLKNKTWGQYCKEIGSSKRVINRWFNKWFTKEIEHLTEYHPFKSLPKTNSIRISGYGCKIPTMWENSNILEYHPRKLLSKNDTVSISGEYKTIIIDPQKQPSAMRN